MKGYHNLQRIVSLKKRIYEQLMINESSLRFNHFNFLKIPYKDQYEYRDSYLPQNEKPIIK